MFFVISDLDFPVLDPYFKEKDKNNRSQESVATQKAPDLVIDNARSQNGKDWNGEMWFLK